MEAGGARPGALEVGLGAAVALLVAALVGMQLLVVPRFAEMFRDFSAELPLMTRAVLDGAVPVGGAVIALGLGAGGARAALRGRGAVGVTLLAAGAVVGLGALALSLYALYAPVFALAGKVQP